MALPLPQHRLSTLSTAGGSTTVGIKGVVNTPAQVCHPCYASLDAPKKLLLPSAEANG